MIFSLIFLPRIDAAFCASSPTTRVVFDRLWFSIILAVASSSRKKEDYDQISPQGWKSRTKNIKALKDIGSSCLRRPLPFLQRWKNPKNILTKSLFWCPQMFLEGIYQIGVKIKKKILRKWSKIVRKKIPTWLNYLS